MQSSNPEDFFQTQTSIEDAARRKRKSTNTVGSPIKVSSKPLALLVEPETANPNNQTVLVAESSGQLSRLHLGTGKIITRFKGAESPLTCIAVGHDRIYAGCWDKLIYVWPTKGATGDPAVVEPVERFSGHEDFVKTVLIVPFGPDSTLLVSGGSDGLIYIHDCLTGKLISIGSSHMRGVLSTALDQHQPQPNQFAILFSSDSRLEILRWRLDRFGAILLLTPDEDAATATAGPQVAPTPILHHDTSVFKIRFDLKGDLWSASADGSVKRIVRKDGFATARPANGFRLGRFVRDLVLVDDPDGNDDDGLVCAACDDEDVWVWEKDDQDTSRAFRLWGHFGTVSALGLVGSHTLLSASLDGTIRRWGLAQSELEQTVLEGQKQAQAEALLTTTDEPEPEQTSEIQLTAEEEAELADLMSSEED